MASLFTQFKNALGALVGYAEIDLGLGQDGIPKRIPQSVPSDAAGMPLFSSANPGAVTVSDGAGPLTVDGTVGLAAGTLSGLAQDGADATGVTPPAGGAGLRGWLSGIYAKLPALSGGKIPVDIGSATVTLSGPVTISNEVEVKNDAGNPIPVRSQPGITPVQTYVPVSAFTAGNTAGAGGTNATVALAVTTTSSSSFLSIDNTGSADAEVWFGAIPADANVGQAPKKGKPLPAGTGLFFDVRIPVGPIYVTAASATGLSVVTG